MTGEDIRSLREDHKISQRELAKAVEKDFTAMSRIENGDRPVPDGFDTVVISAIDGILRARENEAREGLEKLESLAR